MAEGVLKPGESIECKGHFFPDNQAAVRCHTYRPAEGRTGTHGPLESPEALAKSCNIFFYELARRLGPERFVAWMQRFGIERELGTGLGFARRDDDGATRVIGEAAGSLPDAELLAEFRKNRDRVSPVLLGIGQGAITWTPLHAAHAYATIARGGKVVAPRLVRGLPTADEVDLGIPGAAIRESLEGLRASVNESYGTGHHLTIDGDRELLFDLPDLAVWGKTGTATASKFAIDGDRDGSAETRVQTDHAWFVGLVGERGGAPRYAVAVILEYGGSGGKVAGPVAAEVMRSIAAEGYLGDTAQRSAGRVEFRGGGE
jgi:penicillin-binding protein 2